MITQFQLSFESVIEEKPVTLSSVTGSQLHGLWFSSLLPAVTSEETTWLHEHPSPKPFSLAPITEKTGRLTGLRVATFQERAAALFQAAAVQAKASGDAIRLGNHQIEITALRQDKPVSFMELLQLEPRRSLTLHFLTPTAFKRGPRAASSASPGERIRPAGRCVATVCPALHSTAVRLVDVV
ncbi:MAG: hypothetical protein M5U34_36110 [Chloroflexi bacterium]|nr:hypothetical protein [Chloroflexota bacterium]